MYQLRESVRRPSAPKRGGGALAPRCVAQIQRRPLRRAAAVSRVPGGASAHPVCHSARPPRRGLASDAADRRPAAADWCARLNQLAGGLALCVLPPKNGNRGDSIERAAHGPGLAAGAGFCGTIVRSLEKAGADIKLVTVATPRSIRRQRRRAADDAGRPRRRRGTAATIGVALRVLG